jgi:hypothetical protein
MDNRLFLDLNEFFSLTAGDNKRKSIDQRYFSDIEDDGSHFLMHNDNLHEIRIC